MQALCALTDSLLGSCHTRLRGTTLCTYVTASHTALHCQWHHTVYGGWRKYLHGLRYFCRKWTQICEDIYPMWNDFYLIWTGYIYLQWQWLCACPTLRPVVEIIRIVHLIWWVFLLFTSLFLWLFWIMTEYHHTSIGIFFKMWFCLVILYQHVCLDVVEK